MAFFRILARKDSKSSTDCASCDFITIVYVEYTNLHGNTAVYKRDIIAHHYLEINQNCFSRVKMLDLEKAE